MQHSTQTLALGAGCFWCSESVYLQVRGVLARMAAWDLGALGRRMPGLRGPVFLHLGGRDTTVPISWSGRTYGILPQARGITVPELGHLAHEEAAELVARQIGAWALASLKQTAR